MHLHQECGGGANRSAIVVGMGTIGRADLAQQRPATRHYLGNAERAADLDQFTARNNYFASLGKRIKDEQYRGGIIVDDGCRLGAGQRATTAA